MLVSEHGCYLDKYVNFLLELMGKYIGPMRFYVTVTDPHLSLVKKLK